MGLFHHLVLLADFAAATSGPLIIAGDANAVNLSQSYHTIRGAGLQDAWEVAGFGLSGTFPGSALLQFALENWPVVRAAVAHPHRLYFHFTALAGTVSQVSPVRWCFRP